MKTSTIRLALGGSVIFGYFGTMHALLINGIPSVNSEPIWLLVGGLSTAFTGIMAYYFGSSSSATQVTAMLENKNNSQLMLPPPMPPVGGPEKHKEPVSATPLAAG